ncbi:hypothetical protein HWQ67_17580, partial [Candidatus Magnetobacterium casensis]
DLQEKILAKLEILKQSRDWLKEEGQFIPYPEAWLNAKGWLDEVEVESKKEVPKHLKGLQKVWEGLQDGEETVPLLDGKVS